MIRPLEHAAGNCEHEVSGLAYGFTEAFITLDEWLSGNGSKPADWRGSDDVRYHSSDDMTGPEFEGVYEPVAVVVRPDDSVDAYGYIAVLDQRGSDQ